MTIRELKENYLAPTELIRIWCGSAKANAYKTIYEGKASELPEGLMEARVKDLSAGYRKGPMKPILIAEVKWEDGI